MTTTSSDTNLSQLVINELTQEEYEALTPEDNQLYLTPDESANQDLSNLSATGQAIIDGKADTTLSNVSSIDSNSAVQTALDGKVSKTGDTMSGDLIIQGGQGALQLKANQWGSLILQNSNINKSVAPSSNQFMGIDFRDTNGTRIGFFGVSEASGSTDTNIVLLAKNSLAFSFPKTTCCDGQWVAWTTTILNDESLNASTNLTKTLAVPNDGHVYEVLFSAAVVTGSTSGNAIYCTLATNKVSSVNVCGCRTRTASTVASRGAIILPISYATNNLTITRSTSQNGTCDLVTRAYRRIGTNT